MQRYISIVFLFLFQMIITSGVAQVLYRVGPEHADCKNAIEIFDTIYGPTTPPSGSGEVMEFNSHLSDPYSFQKEHNTVWYTFEVLRDCDLLLDIIPVAVEDDYDFILFRYQGPETCDLIRQRKIKPVRSCISRNDPSIGSRTGLSYDATEDFIHAGPGPSYARALPVEAGERYILVLDNVYPDGKGHTVHLKYRNCRDKEPEVVEEPSNFLNINVRDANSHDPVNAEIVLIKRSAWRDEQPPRSWQDTSRMVIRLEQQTSYQVVVRAKGYIQFTTEIRTGSNFQTFFKTANLQKLVEGESVSFTNILFMGGSDKLLRESFPVLDNIAETMKDQPNISLKIIGHVNDPLNARSNSTPAHNQSLSERRARSVYNYLVRRGVEPGRLSWKGVSNSQMVYPYATSEEQMQANRRVEFQVTIRGNP